MTSQPVGRRIDRHVLEQTPNTARAVKSALRSPEYFDARQVTRIEIGRRESATEVDRRAVGNVVNRDADGRIQ